MDAGHPASRVTGGGRSHPIPTDRKARVSYNSSSVRTIGLLPGKFGQTAERTADLIPDNTFVRKGDLLFASTRALRVGARDGGRQRRRGAEMGMRKSEADRRAKMISLTIV